MAELEIESKKSKESASERAREDLLRVGNREQKSERESEREREYQRDSLYTSGRGRDSEQKSERESERESAGQLERAITSKQSHIRIHADTRANTHTYFIIERARGKV